MTQSLQELVEELVEENELDDLDRKNLNHIVEAWQDELEDGQIQFMLRYATWSRVWLGRPVQLVLRFTARVLTLALFLVSAPFYFLVVYAKKALKS